MCWTSVLRLIPKGSVSTLRTKMNMNVHRMFCQLESPALGISYQTYKK